MPTRPKSCRFASATKALPGADEHVDRFDRLGAEGHRPDRLDAAENIDLMRAAEMHRGDDRRMRAAVDGRGGGDDPRHAGDRRRQHRHVRRRDHRKFAARHIAADRLYGDVLVPEDHAWLGLDFDIGHRRLLRFGETADLRLREANVLHVSGRDFRHGRFDLGGRQPKRRRRVAVELLAQRAHGRIALCFDLRKRRLHSRANLGVVFRALRSGFSRL